ncbi:cytochrome-c peroxidase [Curvibacter gracilis]|uniref:cytochrome-c peroxidase n=1 Tax=Curvibacter gracilis TaxID=230310 RepID=UPI0004B29F4B|nr:cytochrome c peroxidase [Curvibacter gracilis]
MRPVSVLSRSLGLFGWAALLTACGGADPGNTVSATSTSVDLAALDAKVAVVATATVPLTPLAQLGQQIFNDTNLSVPRGTSCASCHTPGKGFADNHGGNLGVAVGSQPSSIGLRNSLSNAYSARTPAFAFVPAGNGQGVIARGGLFWDGRADTLAQQALGPFLEPSEMNNPSAAAVVQVVAQAAYAPAFMAQFGNSVFSTPAQAFGAIGQALQAFEQSQLLQPFTSKYDAVLRQQASFTPTEQRGLNLFLDRQRGNCAGCHHANPATGNPLDSPFTDFSYMATGVPRNPAIPANANPAFYDLGLCGPKRTAPTPPAGLDVASLCGKFRMPSLRNVALRQRYMHNGFFSDLHDVVAFYSTRVSNPQHWYGPSGVPNDLPAAYQANLETQRPPFNRRPAQGPVLTQGEINDLVAFLGTLSDGYTAP